MKLSAVTAETRPIVVPFDAGDLKVSYRPNALTANRVDAIQAAMLDPKKQTDAIFQMIGTILADWDMEDDAGKVIPIDDVNRLREEVGMGVFSRIFAAMQDDQNPEKAGSSS